MVSRLSWCSSWVWVDTVAVGAIISWGTLNKSSDSWPSGEDAHHSSKVEKMLNEHGLSLCGFSSPGRSAACPCAELSFTCVLRTGRVPSVLFSEGGWGQSVLMLAWKNHVGGLQS